MIFKVVTKVIVGRLKELMPKLISEIQSSFVPGRHVTDNIIVAQEIIHSMRRMKGKRGVMTIKVDLEKAYDRLSWSFIRDTLIDARLPSDLIRIIMQCIESPTLSVLWNGCASQSFVPSRGIRQGDLLSPYIFVMCLERLSQRINKSVEEDNCKPFTVRKNGLKISHLYFADDMLLFAEASLEQMNRVNQSLNEFCAALG